MIPKIKLAISDIFLNLFELAKKKNFDFNKFRFIRKLKRTKRFLKLSFITIMHKIIKEILFWESYHQKLALLSEFLKNWCFCYIHIDHGT